MRAPAWSTWAYNDTVPEPKVRFTGGDTLEVAIRNDLPEPTTIHWHGLALRNDMDGVPDLAQTPIAPGESFTYRFVAAQHGTYWFDPHMGLQLERGLYAPLVVEERSGAGGYDIDQVIVLDDRRDGIDGTPEKTYEGLTSMGGSGNDGMSGMDNMGAGGMSMFQSNVLGGDAGDVAYPLHLINAGSDTAYRVALGGHRMTVTHSDGGAPTIGTRPRELDGRLLRYSDLHAAEANRLQNKKTDVDQAVELTGSMMPDSWVFDGKSFADHDQLEIHQGPLPQHVPPREGHGGAGVLCSLNLPRS